MATSAIIPSSYPLANGVPAQQSDWIKMANKFRTDGVVRNVDGLQLNEFLVQPHAGGGLPPATPAIDVLTGRAWIQGVFLESGANIGLDMLAANLSNDRIDRVVLSLQTAVPNVVVQVYAGTPALTPTPPALVRSGSQYDIGLAQIRVPAGSTTVTAGNILDERAWSGTLGAVVTAAVPSAPNAVTGLPLIPVGANGFGPTLPSNLIVPISGTTAIQQLPIAPAGTRLTLQFQGILTIAQSPNNIRLARALTTSANTSLEIWSDGATWYEINRAGETIPANQILAGSATTGAIVPTPRALVNADMPANVQSSIAAIPANQVMAGSATSGTIQAAPRALVTADLPTITQSIYVPGATAGVQFNNTNTPAVITDMNQVITVQAGSTLRVDGFVMLYHTAAGIESPILLVVDGSAVLTLTAASPGINYKYPVYIVGWEQFYGSAGAHTVQLQWQTGSGQINTPSGQRSMTLTEIRK